MGNFIKYTLSKETLSKFKSCFDLNGSPKKVENIEWQYFQNPTLKKNYVEIAYDKGKGKTAAIYALTCVDFKLKEKRVVGTQSIDTLVDEDYRKTTFLFLRQARDMYKKTTEDNVSLVYGFPNGKSVHGFKALRWKILDPVPFLIKPLRSKYFTNKIRFLKFLPNLRLSYFNFNINKKFIIKESNDFPDSVDEVWSDFSSKIKVCVIRDKKYLSWRYSKPNENYKVAHCYDNNNKYLGFIVYIVKEKHNGKIGYIMELIYDTKVKGLSSYLLNHAIKNINKEKADCILAWNLPHSHSHKVFKSKLFLNMPEKIRPIELHFGARSFDKKYKELLSKRENWYISYSDSDTV